MGATGPTGLIVPLYSYPGPEWRRLVASKRSHPDVPIIAVVNPCDGPGTNLDPNYLDGILCLQSAGIVVLGYVATGFGSRSLASVIGDIHAYRTMYPTTGVFFDEMPNVHESGIDYSVLGRHARSLGVFPLIGNPGARLPPPLGRMMDLVVIYEDAGLPSESLLASRADGMSRKNTAFISYDTVLPDLSYLRSVSNHVGYIYITDEMAPNPYSVLPSYLPSLLDSMSQAGRPGASYRRTMGGLGVLTRWRSVSEDFSLTRYI